MEVTVLYSEARVLLVPASHRLNADEEASWSGFGP